MVDPTTTNLILAVPTRGSDAGTWDTPVNGDMNIIDACAGTVTTTSVSNANVTLTTTQSQVSILRFTGTITGNVIITLGAVIKSWIVENNTVNPGFLLRIIGNPGTGNFLTPPPGSSQIYWDGTNMNFINLPPMIGGYWDYSGAAVPPWVTQCSVPPFLLCDGSTFNAGVYPLLSAILGGSILPDSRARARIPLDGGTGRVTIGGSGIDGSTRFTGGGSQNQPINQSNLPNITFPNSLGINGFIGLSSAANGVLNNQGVGAGANVSGGGGAYNIGAITASNSLGISGSVTSGGSGSNLIIMQPVYVGGITMIRAA